MQSTCSSLPFLRESKSVSGSSKRTGDGWHRHLNLISPSQLLTVCQVCACTCMCADAHAQRCASRAQKELCVRDVRSSHGSGGRLRGGGDNIPEEFTQAGRDVTRMGMASLEQPPSPSTPPTMHHPHLSLRESDEISMQIFEKSIELCFP